MINLLRRENLRVTARFDPQDIWIGIYWNMKHLYYLNAKSLDVYICFLPMLPIHIEKFWPSIFGNIENR